MGTRSHLFQCVAVAALAALAACGSGGGGLGSTVGVTPAIARPVPGFSRVALIVLENAGYDQVLADPAFAAIGAQGASLSAYFAEAHHSLPNYLAMTSGVGPTSATKSDCQRFDCQVEGDNLASTLDAAGVIWKGYFGGTDDPCLTPVVGQSDEFVRGYLTHHNPFAYYPSVGANAGGGTAQCRSHLRPLAELGDDAGSGSLPRFMFVVADSCDDGHDQPCADGRPGGVPTALAWAGREMAAITASPAWDSRSLLILTFDEGADSDVRGCCGSAGGGRTATVLISALAPGGTVSATPHDPYSILRTVEDGLGLSPLLGESANRPPISEVFG